jgi:ribose transport system substrate-binding protein
MQRKNDSLVIVSVTALASVAMVSIVAIYLTQMEKRFVPSQSNDSLKGLTAQKNSVKEVDLASLKATDQQPLLPEIEGEETLPSRPSNPKALPETDAGHWYDQEFAVWNVKRENLPPSPRNGPQGKKVVYLKFVDHPYLTAMSRGMQKVADAYGIQLTTMCAENDSNKQNAQVEQVVTMKPDLVIINPVSPKASASMKRKLHKAGIPIIASNQLCTQEALKYCLAWTGPDDWGQFRMLTQKFAELMNFEGGYAIVRHFPGNSCYDSRTHAVVTELKKIAPKMELLEMQTTNLDMIETERVVSGWLTRYGKKLKGIVSADDSGAQLGINKACKNAGREEVVRIAAGNSKVGMEAIKAGSLHAITYQSAEADGAVPLYLGVKWFKGETIPTVQYLPKRIITAKNVDQFLPPQW